MMTHARAYDGTAQRSRRFQCHGKVWSGRTTAVLNGPDTHEGRGLPTSFDTRAVMEEPQAEKAVESAPSAAPEAPPNQAPPISISSALDVLANAAAVPTNNGGGATPVSPEEGGALIPVASAVVEEIPHQPLSIEDQGDIIARQQQEISQLRELVASQAQQIEQLRAACGATATATGTSPPPPYGPSSPSTELAASEELDELSPSRQDAAGERRPQSQPLHHQHVTLHAAHAAAASLAAYASSSYDPHGRPASSLSAATRGPPTPNNRPHGKLPRTPNSINPSPHHRWNEDGNGVKRFRSENGSAAPSPAAREREPPLLYSAVTLSLPPYKTTVRPNPTQGFEGFERPPHPNPKRIGGGRTNTHVLWTPEEDICLRQLVEEHGEQAWALVASRMPHERNNKQCRERWRNHLRPGALQPFLLSPSPATTLVLTRPSLSTPGSVQQGPLDRGGGSDHPRESTAARHQMGQDLGPLSTRPAGE